MINGLEGIPGSGKSYEAVVFHVLEALKKGRKVITNLPLQVERWAALDPRYVDLIEIRTRCKPVRGTWDATRIDEHGNGKAFELFEDRHSELPTKDVPVDREATIRLPSESVPVFGHVWDFYSEWKHPTTGQGPLFVIDECHVALPRGKTPDAVIQWFKLHRHFNADVLLMTQNFRDMCSEIAGLLAIMVRCRKADILGRKDAYIRKVHGGFRGPLISQEERKYLPQYFSLYKSHTQGQSVAEAAASDVSPFIVKFKRFTWAWWICGVLFAAWAFWPGKGKPIVPVKRSPVAAAAAVPAPAASRSASAPSGVASAVAKAENASEGDPEPYGGKELHISGRLRMGDRQLYVFTVSDKGRRIFEVTSVDLKEAGYKFQPVNDCAGTLRFGGKSRAVTCDAPMLATGSSDRPIVVGQPVAVSDKRAMGGSSSGGCGPDCYVVPSSAPSVQGYDPDRAAMPAKSVFSLGVSGS